MNLPTTRARNRGQIISHARLREIGYCRARAGYATGIRLSEVIVLLLFFLASV